MLTAVAHVAHDASQAFVHFLERAHQVARFVARGHLDVGGQIALGDLARGVHRLLQRPHDTARDQPAQQHADGHAQHRQRDHQRAHAFVQVGAGLHRHGGGLFLAHGQVRHQVVQLLRRDHHALLYFLDGRIGLGQRLRLGRAEEVLGLALPGVLDLDELRQQALAFVGLEGLAGAVAQLVHGLHGIVKLLAQRLALLLAGRGQIPGARASGVDQVDVRFLDIRNAAQLGVIEPVVHFVDAGESPDAEGADHAAYHRHN